MPEERAQRRLAAILAADVVGYSRQMQADERGTLARLKALRADVIDPRVARYGGRIFKTTGDGALAEFASAVDAVECAIDIQRALGGGADDARGPVALRIGVSLGDVIVEDEDLYGNGVNVAARMEGLAEPGGICISGNVQEHVGNVLDISLEDLGEQPVKNIDRPVRCYSVRLEGDGGAKAVSPPLPDKPSVAVLPFTNMSGDPDQEYFSDGITEDIITALSRVRQFFVIARNTTFTFKDRAVDVQSIARELGVRYILEGSVRKAGNRVRVTAQLIDGASGNHLWAERYDRDPHDIFAVQDDITLTVVGAIQPELSRAEQARARSKPPENMDAWDCHHRGLAHLWRRTIEDNAEAQALFRRAAEYDPNFCAPLAYEAYAKFQLYTLTHSDSEAIGEDMLAVARRAMRADDRDALAHYALGGAHLFRGDIGLAIESLERAVEINPSFAAAQAWLADCYTRSDRPERALPLIETAMRLSPHDPLWGAFQHVRALAHFRKGEFEEAEQWARRSSDTANPRPMAFIIQLASLGHLGRESEAGAVLERFAAHYPDFLKSDEAVLREYSLFRSIPYQESIFDGLRKARALGAG